MSEEPPFRHDLDLGPGTLARGDLLKAKQYLDRLQEGDEAVRDRTIREALTSAAIISYCRPFKGSDDEEGNREIRIPRTVIDSLPNDLPAFHDQIVKTRDQAWAHSDWGQHQPKLYGDRGIISRRPWRPFTDGEVRRFQRLIHEIGSRVWITIDDGS